MEDNAAVKNTINQIARMLFFCFVTKDFFLARADWYQLSHMPSLLYKNAFQSGDIFSFYMYLSDLDNTFADFNDDDSLLWSMKNLKYGDWQSGDNFDGSFTKSFKLLKPGERFINNRSLYIHIFIIKGNQIPSEKCKISYGYLKLNKQQHVLNFDKPNTKYSVEEKSGHVLNLLHPNLSVNYLIDNEILTKNTLPSSNCGKQIRFNDAEKLYYPPIIFNNYWNLNDEYILIDNNTSKFEFTVTFSPLSLFKWQHFIAPRLNKNIPSKAYYNDNEEDFVKRIINVDTGIYVFYVVIVGIFLLSIYVKSNIKNGFKKRQVSTINHMLKIFKTFLWFFYMCNNYLLTAAKRPFLAAVLLYILMFIEHMLMNYKFTSTSIIKNDGKYHESMFSKFDEFIFLSVISFTLESFGDLNFYTYFLFSEWFIRIFNTFFLVFIPTEIIIMIYQNDSNEIINEAPSTFSLVIDIFIHLIPIYFVFILRLPSLFYFNYVSQIFRDIYIFKQSLDYSVRNSKQLFIQ